VKAVHLFGFIINKRAYIMSADLFLCLTSLLAIVEWLEFLLIILEDLPFVFLLLGNNDSFLGFV